MSDLETASIQPDHAIRVSPTSRQLADVNPIIVRTTSTTKLIFRPVLLDNPKNPSAAMDGTFIFERKSPNGQWSDFTALPLSKLKADLWQTIRALAKNGTTVFLTTQYLEEADELADTIAVLHQGKIIVKGTAGELKQLVPRAKVSTESEGEVKKVG